jgi:hypothetical protein
MGSFRLLQPFAAAQVANRNQKKTDRHQGEYQVPHTALLVDSQSTPQGYAQRK